MTTWLERQMVMLVLKQFTKCSTGITAKMGIQLTKNYFTTILVGLLINDLSRKM